MIINNILQIADYIVESFIHTWPYLLVTIPIAVAVKMSGASRFINRAFTARPILAILLATVVGAFSPLCSCSVIPVVAALLISGVPLAPVMSFWLASPSMDPEIFFLTVSSLGWQLAVWRLAATLVMSLGGGFITHMLVQRDLLGSKILRETRSVKVRSGFEILRGAWQGFLAWMKGTFAPKKVTVLAVISGGSIALPYQQTVVAEISSCGCGSEEGSHAKEPDEAPEGISAPEKPPSFWIRLGKETWTATTMVIRFMLLAWFLGALIQLYLPETWISSTLGAGNSWAIITAALLGIPVYTSNLAAMPLVGGLLAGGMHPAAALAFLISGPTTTLPAMSAVWGLVNRRVFALYIAFSLVSAVVFGYIFIFSQ